MLLLCGTLPAQQNDALRNAAAALSAHQYQQAIDLLKPLIEHDARDPRLWTLRGLAQDGAGDPHAALVSLDRALSLSPRYLPALEAAAQSTYSHGEPSAPHYVDRLLAVAPDNSVAHAMAGALAYVKHDCPGAAEHFARSGDALYQSANAVAEYADCLVKADRPEDAAATLSRGIAQHPASTQLKYDLAVADLQQHKPQDAITVLEPLAASNDSGLLNLLATAYVKVNRPDDAFRVLEQAIAISPTDPVNYLDLAILCLEHNQESRSVTAASAGIARTPRPASLYLIRGVAYAQLADYDKAEADFNSAALLEPNQPNSTIAMSLLYSDRNQVQKEEELLWRQLKLTPDDAVSNYLLADLLVRGGAEPGKPEFQEAQGLLAKSLAAKPNSAEAQVLMGKMLEEQKQPAEALQHYEQALKADPRNRSALDRKFVLLRRLHRNDEAAAVLLELKQVLSADRPSTNAEGQVRVESQPAHP
jgi:tetratricopeptide (TPR) repeat protein